MNLIYDFSNTSPADYTLHGNIYQRTEASRIYLARPGKRLLGALNGIDESTCNLIIDFINADEISFDVYRYLGVSKSSQNNTWYGYYEESSWYHYVDILMEIYVDGFGWFFIDESPTVHNDGIKEYKSVIAKSYEYTLHQYDLETFDVNTATSTSREMIAEDNVYTYYSSAEVHYNIFRDRVLFYRDTTEYKALLNEVDEHTTYAQLQELLVNYPNFVKTSWRIQFDLENIVDGLTQARDEATDTHKAEHYQDLINNASTLTADFIKKDLILYPDLIKYLPLIIDKKKRRYDEKEDAYIETDENLRVDEFVELEYKRIKDLSLLDLCLSDVPDTWTIGYVDTTFPTDENGNLLYKDVNGNPLLLKDETGSFEIDAQDVYTFMVNELAGYFNCVFQFDTVNNIINVYRIESIGKDTRIFLSFRNVENDVTITPAQELFTQFTVENSEGFGITNVNFAQREIEDISYFLKPEYLPQDLIDKYKRYVADKESKRDTYVTLSKEHNKQLEKCNELINRVPSDMLNIDQLANFKSKDQIEESIANYYALLVGMLKAFIFQDTSGITVPKEYSEDDYDSFSDYITAWDNYIDDLYDLVDINNPVGEGVVTFKGSVYYNTYCACREFTIPNLLTAYKNLDLPSYEEKDKYKDAFEYIFDEEHPDCKEGVCYGDWYGINELKIYQKYHLDKMQSLEEFVTPLEDIQDAANNGDIDAEAFLEKISDEYETKHDLYIKYKNSYESVTRVLEKRQKEYDDEKEILDNIDDERKLLANAMLIRNWSEAVGYTIYNQEDDIYLYDNGKDENQQDLDDVFLMLEHDVAAFTDAEIDLISRFYRHTDYSNDNINHLTNIDDGVIDVDKELEMLHEAQDELYAESHPQYNYTTNVDNLLANNEYASFHPEFDVGNFVRLGLDDETQVNLRMIKLTFNPMTMENNLDIEFSNMINYRGKRNDFANLLDSVITSAKNTITARYNRSADADNTVQVTYDLVQKILQSAPFASYTTASQQSAVSAATGAFGTLSAEYLKTKNLSAELAEIDTLQADSAFMHYLSSNLVVATTITADQIVDGNNKTVVDLVNDNIDIGSITTDIITGHDSSGNYYIDLISGEISIDKLKSSDGKSVIDFINGIIDVDTITTNIITGKDSSGKYYIDLLAGEIAIDKLISSDGKTAIEFVNGAVDIDAITTNIITGKDSAGKYYIDLLAGEIAIDKLVSSDGSSAIDFVNSSIDIDNIATNLITGQNEDNQYYIDLLTGALNMDTIYTNLITGQDSSGDYYIDLLNGEIKIDKLVDSDGNTAIDFVNSSLNMDTITTNLITGQDGNDDYYIDMITGALNMSTIASDNAFINTLTAQSGFIDYLNSNLVVANAINAENADIAELSTRSLTADKADIATLATESLTARQIDASNINVDSLFGESAFFEYLEANLITASEIQVDDLKAKLAQIDTLTAGSAFVNYLQSLSSTVAQSTITDAYIYNAVAGKITVADLAAGDIVLGNQMRILTNSGATEGMVMSGSELQFLDGNGNPSISIGYNTVSDGQGGTTVDYDHPAIIIKDENGSVMLNSSGLSQGDVGLAPMIQTSSISKNQLNFPIVDTDENGNISITNIKDGTGGNFGVEYTTFKQGTQDALDEIESKKMYRVVVESDNGNIFKNGDVNCTLSCRVYSWDDEITNDINAANFTWTRKSKNSTDDTQWNANHSGGTKSITITPSDVYGRSVFYCTVTLPDGTVQSSG